jgi:arylsulfatase A-like enzyme
MSRRPNIVLILADDHGYGDVSMHGTPDIQTPHIDRIAQDGMRFSQFYANSSVCSPSRAALLTGRYPDRVGVPGVIRTHPENNWGYFSQEAVTLPAMLKRADYHTALIGKWHLGLEAENHPRERGFDHFHGFLGDMMDDYYTHLRHDNNYMRQGFETIDPRGHATDLFSDWSAEFIRSRQNESDPFFLYLAYNAPHTPIQPPQEWIDRIREREPEASDTRVEYLALVEHMDDGIGRVLDALDETGQASNTIVIYTSDNGGQMNVGADNGPWRGQKGQMYEGGIRVPACVRWPGEMDSGASDDAANDTAAMLMDLYPTLCDAVGLPIDHEIEGQSILPTLRGGTQDFSERVYYWIRKEGGQQFLGLDQHAVRRGDVKLLHNQPFEPLELYHLGNDPAESADLRDSNGAAFAEMRQLLQAEMQRAGGVPWQRG